MSWNCSSCSFENKGASSRFVLADEVELQRCEECDYIQMSDKGSGNLLEQVNLGAQAFVLVDLNKIRTASTAKAELPPLQTPPQAPIHPSQEPPASEAAVPEPMIPPPEVSLPSPIPEEPKKELDPSNLPIAEIISAGDDKHQKVFGEANIPKGAVWNEQDSLWELGNSNKGKKQGEFRYWRKDGTLAYVCSFDADEPAGTFKHYHENGEISQAGEYVEGKIHGKRFFYKTDDETSEEFPGGLPEGAWVYAMNYDEGRLIGGEIINKKKQRICMDGSLFPERPAGVPKDAGFNEKEDIWFTGAFTSDGEDRERTGLWAYWTKEGALYREVNYEDGLLDGLCREYSVDGYLKTEGNYELGRQVGIWKEWRATGAQKKIWEYKSGKMHGNETIFDENGEFLAKNKYREGVRTEYFALQSPDEFYGFRNVHSVRGQFENNQVAGFWKYFDADEEIIRQFDYGSFRGEDFFWSSEAMGDAVHNPDKVKKLRETFEKNEDTYSLFVVAIREVAEEGSAQPIFRFLLNYCPPFTPEVSRAKAGDFVENNPLETMEEGAYKEKFLQALGLIFTGGDAAMMVHYASKVLNKLSYFTLAEVFVNAASVLTPDNKDILTDLDSFSEVAEEHRAEKEREESADNKYLNLIYDTAFDFWPTNEMIQAKLGSEHYEMKIVLNLLQISQLVNSLFLSLAKRKLQVEKLIASGAEVSHQIPDLGEAIELYDDKEVLDATPVVGVHSPDNHKINLQHAHEEWYLLVLICYACGMESVGRITEVKDTPELSSLHNYFIELSHEAEETKDLGDLPLDFDFTFSGIKFVDYPPEFFGEIFAPNIFRLLDLMKWLSGEIDHLGFLEEASLPAVA